MAFPLRNRGPVLETSPVLALAIIAACLGAIVYIMVLIPRLGAAETIVDFDAFYIVGLMIRDGNLAGAYDLATMIEAQRRYGDADSFMPWTYPPHFDLIVALLPALPRGPSYAVFVTLGFLAYMFVIWRLAGQHMTAVLVAMLPALMINISIGQNGFLTGALVGWFCLALLDRRRHAGVPLGLMAIKPHLALGVSVLALARGEWRVLTIAILVALAGAALATLVFGAGVWGAFRTGVEQAGTFLSLGAYPMFRMTSPYAALHTAGVAPSVALAIQGAIAVAAVVIAAWVARKVALRPALGVACLLSVVISPYTYDYDLTILGVGLALIAGDLLERATAIEKLVLLALCWLGCGWGLLRARMTEGLDADTRAQIFESLPSIGGLVCLLLLALGARVMLRSGPPVRR